MAGKDKKPEIRFAGFIDAWEQRKLDEIADVLDGDRGNNYPNGNELQKRGHTLFLSATNVTTNGFMFDNNQYITEEKSNSMGNGKLVVDDIVLTSRGSIGHIAWYNEATQQQVPFARINSGMLILRSKNFVIPCFVAQFLKSPLGKKQIDFISFGSAQPQLTKKDVSNYIVSFPSDCTEQRKLGDFFDYFDNLITLHQRKYDKLVIVKKSMLEKMFPKDGTNVPEVRFAGFTDAWEHRKLKEISDKVIEKNVNLQFTETFTNSAEFGIISQRDFFDHDISNAENLGSYYVVRNEDFVYNPRISAFAPVGPINRNKLGRNGVMSPLYNVFRTHDIDNTFLEQYFRSRYWHSFMKLNGDSGARSDRFSIKDSVFIEMPIPYPSFKEQLKIGEYLMQLDNLITLHQRELKKLKNIKKSMLEKMFV
ncbi:MAG: restriction endonuclease subunit S [Smithella sp.]